MKFNIAYYLLILYLTVIFKPLIPIISDGWQHAFNNIEHIALVHAKYGSHHLEKEMNENNHDVGQGKNSTLLKSEDQVSFHVVVNQYNHAAHALTFKKQFDLLKYCRLPYIFIAREGPPPRNV